MASPPWLPPLNSHPNYTTQILAEELHQPQNHPSVAKPTFLILVNFSVSFNSNSSEKDFLGLSLTKDYFFPSTKGAKQIISDILFDLYVPFHVNHVVFFQKRFHKSCFKTRSLEKDDSDVWIQQFQSFLHAIISPNSYSNAGQDVFPLKLKFKKMVRIADSEYSSWGAWYNEQNRVEKNFERDYQEAISRPRRREELFYERSPRFKKANPRPEDPWRIECSICLEETGCVRLPCSHVFHGPCIGEWIQGRRTCPVCRFSLPFS